jgi:hypothetical protein
VKRISLLGITFFMFTTLFGCRDSCKRDEELVYQINMETAKKLYAQKSLYQVGHGGRTKSGIEELGLDFLYFQEVDERKARELLIGAAQEYLSAINNNSELQPYLHERPFTIKNIEILISFHKPDRSHVSPKKINLVSLRNGTLTYNIDDGETNRLMPILKETYEEALQRSGTR